MIPYSRNYMKNSLKEFIPHKWKEIGKHYLSKSHSLERDKNKYFFKLQDIKNDIIKSSSYSFLEPIEIDKIESKNNSELIIFKSKINLPWVITSDKNYFNPNPSEKKILTASAHYIEKFQNDLIIFSSVGDILIVKNFLSSIRDQTENKVFYANNNIETFLNRRALYLDYGFGIKDILVHRNKIYVSFIKEVKKNCFNVSILSADIGKESKNFNFEEIFSPNECVNKIFNQDIFRQHQSGGRLLPSGKNSLFLTLGDFNSLKLAQDNKSIFGKVINIDLKNKSFKIVSMGHRNPQGFEKINKNILISTEHGPKGGDEINLHEINKSIENFGWPEVSYGKHYDGKSRSYAPLKHPHIKFGFKEPLFYFKDAIGISQIIKIKNNIFALASLKEKKIFILEIIDNNNLIIKQKYDVGERVRDLIRFQNKLVVLLENTPSIAYFEIESFLN
ncbi:PQQ-dependent sugar dehydrogenase [Candidatus Pelagibacter sp.]|uniref:PQQ-dependent sugar dehydrogenase n=2 Tax=unclassified Candidatus Pelagibacter TaxID=2647897 RepID=UPI003F87D95E